MEIRDLKKDDIPAIVRLAKEVWKKDLDPEMLEELFLNNKFYGTGAFINKELFAFQSTDPERPPGGDPEGYSSYMAPACIKERFITEGIERILLEEFLKLVPAAEVTVISTALEPEEVERIKLLLELDFEFRTDRKIEMNLILA